MQDSASTKDLCSPAVGRLKKSTHIEDINIPWRCKIGKIEYHHSDGQLMLHFDKPEPYHVCIRKSKQFVLLDQLMTQVTETISVGAPDKVEGKKAGRRKKAHVLYQGIPALCFPDMETELQTVCECGNHGDKLITATAEDGSIYSPIKRAPGIVWQYGTLGDERIVEFDHTELLCNIDSKYQNIKIYKSAEFGNALFLDDDIMLGESDLIYTTTLLGVDRNDFKDKSILVLGGGDGGILHELLKLGPKHVIMAEIDDEVIKASRVHLRSVCGDSLDQYSGPNFQIRLEDCVKVLQESVQYSVKFDYIVNDLTEYSVSKEQYGFGYDFSTSNLILELSLKCLSSNGKYLARGNCLSARRYIEKFQKDLQGLGLEFKRRDVHVPSFRETYLFSKRQTEREREHRRI
ncbi:hypothetical protein FSP39_020284 [Pinctada imbricata]|uniref:PABS domain-containing protein n=1 Tax=Pinctada imbricata TaxID=66713 RepID=A0AA89BVD9_PINIB|nr:hypothetical protein FSP39_020284 [Pinctada imbricata]